MIENFFVQNILGPDDFLEYQNKQQIISKYSNRLVGKLCLKIFIQGQSHPGINTRHNCIIERKLSVLSIKMGKR